MFKFQISQSCRRRNEPPRRKCVHGGRSISRADSDGAGLGRVNCGKWRSFDDPGQGPADSERRYFLIGNRVLVRLRRDPFTFPP